MSDYENEKSPVRGKCLTWNQVAAGLDTNTDETPLSHVRVFWVVPPPVYKKDTVSIIC
jgi:hypothetical protein